MPSKVIIQQKPQQYKERTFTPSDSKQCISCGKCWPWITFDLEVVHHTSNVCTRCAGHEIEVKRWKEIGQQMQRDLIKARQKLAKIRGEPVSTAQLPFQILPPPQQHQAPPGAQAQSRGNSFRLAPGQVRQKYLNEEQLSGIRANLALLRSIKEPQRATLWLQLTFTPSTPIPPRAPPSIPQLSIYQSYRSFLAQLSTHPNAHLYPTETPPMDGSELIRLIVRLYADVGVTMRGSPDYTIEGLEWRVQTQPQAKEKEQEEGYVGGHLRGGSKTLDALNPQQMRVKDQMVNRSGSSMVDQNQGYNHEETQIPLIQQQENRYQVQAQRPYHSQPLPQPQQSQPAQRLNVPSPTDAHVLHVNVPGPTQFPMDQQQQHQPISHLAPITQHQPHLQATSSSHYPSVLMSSTNPSTISPQPPSQQHNPPPQPQTNPHSSHTKRPASTMEVQSPSENENDEQDDEDDWTTFSFGSRPGKRAKVDHVTQTIPLTKEQKVLAKLTVTPRPSLSSQSQPHKIDKRQDKEEEIDELEDDDEPVFTPKADDVVDVKEERDRAGSEDEVGDMLI